MSTNLQIGERTLEVKIRPYSLPSQDRPDQQGASRVNLSRDAIVELRTSVGQICYIGKPGEPKREAVVWLASEKLSSKVVQVSKVFQEICGFKLGDDVQISAGGNLMSAESVVLKEIHVGDSEKAEIDAEDRPHWEWFMKKSLGRAQIAIPGMVYKNVSLDGPRRSFIVDAVNGANTSLGKLEQATVVKIATKEDLIVDIVKDAPVSRLAVVDIAGIDQALKKLNRFLSNFTRNFKFTQAKRSCAVFLHGGSGTGKTFILNKIASTGWGKVYRIKSDIKAATLKSMFKEARLSQPSIIVIDNLDKLVSKDDSASTTIAEALEEELDNLAPSSGSNTLTRVLVVAAASNPGNIPISLRELGRFETDIPLPIPDPSARKQILESLSPPIIPESRDEILGRLGDRTHAYTARDLVKLMNVAYEIAEERTEDESAEGDHYLVQEDLEQALIAVRPTAMHDVTLKPPTVRWNEIGGQENVKKALRRAVETPLLHPDRMKRIGASAKKGLLLYGPPGCSKTLSAQAMATEVGFNFFAVKGAELLNMYVGESERAVRDIFARARAASPSIIFFDEIESIASKREGGRSNGVNVLTTLLNEMDGIETLKGVTVLAATNQPQALDLALLRPGRFDKLLYVAPPDAAGREEILRVRQRTMDMADDVDIKELAAKTDGYSGAELVGICQAACDEVLERCETTGVEHQITMEDFNKAIKSVKMQITEEMIVGYEDWAAGTRGESNVD
ncbi:ATPase family gene 2 protein [Phlyctema vagabunda]|uniref:ATPase family gene 2 protein n=1 Tax=Phlyctema vagabunda TaxID=108571 RepID=A0ABR4PUM4_9HELO